MYFFLCMNFFLFLALTTHKSLKASCIKLQLNRLYSITVLPAHRFGNFISLDKIKSIEKLTSKSFADHDKTNKHPCTARNQVVSRNFSCNLSSCFIEDAESNEKKFNYFLRLLNDELRP